MTTDLPRSYHDALRALKLEHDADMNAAFRAYQLVPQTVYQHTRYMEVVKGITSRFKRDAERLTRQYEENGS